MYKDIETFYKKNDPFAKFIKYLTISYSVFLTIALICAIYKWYFLMLIIEAVTIIVAILHFFHFSKEMPSNIKKKVFSVHIIHNTKKMFKYGEIKIFKQMAQKQKIYHEETLKCILEHYRLFISQKQFSVSFVSLISIALPILLSFYNNGSFNTVDLMNSLKYIAVFLIGMFAFYYVINSVVNIKRLILGEDAMYIRLEEIFSELYVECINEKKQKGRDKKCQRKRKIKNYLK